MKISAVGTMRGRPYWKAILLSSLMLFLTAFMLIGGGGFPKDILELVPFVIVFVFLNVSFFLMLAERDLSWFIFRPNRRRRKPWRGA